MRTICAVLVLALSSALFAQPARVRPIGPAAMNAEMSIKQAMEALGNQRKIVDRDLEVLRHLKSADTALTDPMQPENAVQKAYEEVDKAKTLQPAPLVYEGVIKIERELEAARLSPMSADFGRLRARLLEFALGPASRVVARNALRLEEETLAWLRVQELISQHVRMLSEIASDSMRTAQE